MNYNFKVCLFFVLFLSAIVSENIFSQGKITGKVTDKNQAAPDADVKLFNSADSQFVKGTKSDANGMFTIDDIKHGNYRLQVSLMEYSTLTVNNIEISESKTSHSFDTLKLNKKDITTEEINVESEKGLIQFSADKKIFNVGESLLNKGGTALDVLKQTPLVDVDINETVSLRGSSNVKILIDDKPSRFNSLRQIPADKIDKIELITNPPAKYESEGVTGIINIVLKKSDKMGFTGDLNLSGRYTPNLSGNAGLGLNFKKKKTTFFTGLYSGTWNNFYRNTRFTEYYFPSSELTNQIQGRNFGHWIWGEAGVEYELSEGKTVGFELGVGNGRWNNNDSTQSIQNGNIGNASPYYLQDQTRGGSWLTLEPSLYFTNKIGDKGRELSGEISMEFDKERNELTSVTDNFDASQQSTYSSDRREISEFRPAYYRGQLDYTHPLTDNLKIETGFKTTLRDSRNDLSLDTLDYSSNSYINDINTSNNFKLREFINAVYGVFSGTIKDFSYKLGVRAENTRADVELVTTGEKYKHDYFDIFPTVNLSQKLGQVAQLQLSYSRRITRPNMWRLNPFINKRDPRFYYQGNPNLKPEYTDSYEFSVMLYTPIINITPMVFYRKNHDVISNYNYLIDSNISVSSSRNASGSKAYGLDLVLNSNAISWMNLSGTFSFYNTKFDADPSITDYAGEEGFSWKGNLRSTFMLKNICNIEVYYNYQGKRVNAQGTNPPMTYFDIGISKTFMDDKLSATLKINDIFKTLEWGQTVNAYNYRSNFTNNWGSRQLSLNLSYKFANTDESYEKKKNTKNNDNEGTDTQNSR